MVVLNRAHCKHHAESEQISSAIVQVLALTLFFLVDFLLSFLHRFIRTRYSMFSQNFRCEYHSPKIVCTEIGLRVYLLQCMRHADRELLRRCHNSQVIQR